MEFAGADIGEIMTDTAEGNLDEQCLISISHDRASYQSRGINGLNAPPRKVVQGSGTKPAKTNSSSEQGIIRSKLRARMQDAWINGRRIPTLENGLTN